MHELVGKSRLRRLFFRHAIPTMSKYVYWLHGIHEESLLSSRLKQASFDHGIVMDPPKIYNLDTIPVRNIQSHVYL